MSVSQVGAPRMLPDTVRAGSHHDRSRGSGSRTLEATVNDSAAKDLRFGAFLEKVLVPKVGIEPTPRVNGTGF
jgi:hypothetical protein